MGRPIFHLSFPVRDLEASMRFYVEVLGARRGRVRDDRVDVHLRGHQITLQWKPDEVIDEPGCRHFGVVLPWEEWEAEVERLPRAEVRSGPTISFEGTPQEQGKLYLGDPDGNVIELKAYRDVAAALEIAPESETP
jgi:extradiol dioxygenase family protein